ncbi:DNA-binding transcriptional regulator BolA [Aliiroseovarius sp. xm-m-379]|uniref:BolA family protein n=1 Tax=Aliiroseovarius TaxID=1658781 RepID=UPI001568B832|nr:MULTISPECIES: BolA family protein [Aliiroseovarius]NRP11689.1 DNA-binding transcriptional regulator BolA [Aliiroseovarius sp. xm-d-517]NRP25698.1 DNA-binding transcriptional regulator BolA [Aliiroseovarius sp. xm-m-379]NRP31204.1 DNA-binding transcriptional regulator BolA [Aliiroseovarius sp. xm-m-314]NRP34497.1 DNA-binding transcriptional regulator BolA [Aliiroseovarius sp. xm-a-104]NRP41932.1 DNA-binding transcriptional regulator BolA [Aliiroseovarius sp. xm-m-339-2]
MTRRDQIFSKLETAFEPQHLEVIDESEMHRGHAGYQDGGESHFRVVIHAQKLADLSRVARHRAVHQAIGADLMGQIHALALDIKA